MLNIKTSTIYAWVAQGKIPHVKIHGLIRFHPHEVDQWINSFKGNQSTKLPLLPKPIGMVTTSIVSLPELNGRPIMILHGETRPKSSLRRKEKTMGLFKRKQVWWMSFTFKGRQIRKSTGTRQKKLAEKILGTIQTRFMKTGFLMFLRNGSGLWGS